MDDTHRIAAARLHHPPAAGFSLIEALVTLLILSVGLLGMAALQIQGLRATHTASLYTQAVSLATDATEQLRARRRVDLPAQELDDWLARIAMVLPQGHGVIESAADAARVQVTWDTYGMPVDYTLTVQP